MRIALLGVVFLALDACTCRPAVNQIQPSLGATPSGIDFAKVKVAQSASQTVVLSARTNAPVSAKSLSLENDVASVFSLGSRPTVIEALGSTQLVVTFSPKGLAAYTATLVIESNDSETPTKRLAVAGEGAKPILEVTPECLRARGCTDTAVVSPPSIDFGLEPRVRSSLVDTSTLPTVNLVNSGPVALTVARVAFTGSDAAAFSLAGNSIFPDGGLVLEPSGGVNLQLQFAPTSEGQTAYNAALSIESDDPDKLVVDVALKGQLAPNAPPVVCASLVRVVPQLGGDGPRDYSGSADWAPLLVPPVNGYDFRLTRDVRPGDLVVVSASSDSSNSKVCTYDPEDGRTGLTYAWSLVSRPSGASSVSLSGAATAQAQLRPFVSGDYELELTVRDAAQSATTVRMRFAVVVKQDLVAQLQWPGFEGVDLDLHLVRPGAQVFSFFNAGPSLKTSGDINGFAVNRLKAMAASGFNFDWGAQGAADDPVLNLDDTGTGALVENVSLNSPENDPACATASCTYGVYVHSFKDGRVGAGAQGCMVDGGEGCSDGQHCSCGDEFTCVVDALPRADAGTGVGRCVAAPRPVVRIFLKASASPSAAIPLDGLLPPDPLSVGAPCHMLHVADISWPSRASIGSLPDGGTPAATISVPGADGSGRVVSPEVTRFGYRQAGGSLQCSPDTVEGTVDWYSSRPR